MKHVLTEAYVYTKKKTSIDPSKPGNFRRILVNDDAFNVYVEALTETLPSEDQAGFRLLAENTRTALMENSMYAINPYETLSLPILRVFYPRLIAKEGVTVSPMDKPDVIKPFLKAKFTKSGGSTEYDAPVMDQDISKGVGVPASSTLNVPSETNILVDVLGLNAGDAHLQRDFIITEVSDSTGSVQVNIQPAVEGHFSAQVSLPGGDDVISGKVDYLNGIVDVSSVNGIAQTVTYSVTVSLEENKINPRVEFSMDKVRLYAIDRQISTSWTINMEQDMRALFDINIQAELVTIIGQQLATDIDREIINSLIQACIRLTSAKHKDDFDLEPPAGWAWGRKYWHENVIPKMDRLSAQVYTDTNIGEANVILANPLDAIVLESLNGFAYTGTASDGGDVGYRTATVVGGKWKVFTSPIVPQGKMVLIHKPDTEMKAIYIYAPYVPAVLHPYPLGATPSLTILSRYATALIRANGIALLNITDSA